MATTDLRTRSSNGTRKLSVHPCNNLQLRKIVVQPSAEAPEKLQKQGPSDGPSKPDQRRCKTVKQQQQPGSASNGARRRSPVLTRRVEPVVVVELPDLGPRGGILKRSSTFLASLRRGRGSAEVSNGNSPACANLRSLLGGKRRLANGQQQQQQQPRKCVSFSSDTSFEKRNGRDGPQKERSFGRTALHEAKLYRKGVLQDLNGGGGGCGGEQKTIASVSPPGSRDESALGGPRALLGAARDGDDDLIKRILDKASRSGLGAVDVNAVDASGRSAISYMAGNGSALMLEACLALSGADANLADNEANTALHFAAQAGQTECLNILLQRCPGIEVDARNSLGFTPLMKAALQGRTKCAKILLFAGANPALRDQGRGLRAEQWARFCGRHVCAEVIERFARHRLLEKTTSCRWGSEPELAAQLLQGKLTPTSSIQSHTGSLKSKIRRVFRTSSHTDKPSFNLVSQLTSAALCASSPVLPKPGDLPPAVKSLVRPLSVPQLRITLVTPQDIIDKTGEKQSYSTSCTEKVVESSMVKPPRTKKKGK